MIHLQRIMELVTERHICIIFVAVVAVVVAVAVVINRVHIWNSSTCR